MKGFAPRITRINGLSDSRRLPRLGIIRLGIKVKSAKSNTGCKCTRNEFCFKCSYPKETPHFVVPDEVAAIYGPEPTELDVMIPINDIDAVFPQAYKFYGSSRGLKCSGNGKIAYAVNKDTKEMEEKECPCDLLESGKCAQTGSLMVMLPQVSVGGIYQITTKSINSIIDVNSGIDFAEALYDRFAMIPLILRRVKTITHHDEKKQTHYTLQLVPDGNIDTINALRRDSKRVIEHHKYLIPTPREVNPEMEPPDIIEDEEATVTDEAAVIDDQKSQAGKNETVTDNSKTKTTTHPAHIDDKQPPWVEDAVDEGKGKEEGVEMINDKQRGELNALMPKEFSDAEKKDFFDWVLGKGKKTKKWASIFIENFDIQLKRYLKHIMTKGKSTGTSSDQEDKFDVKKAVKEAHDNDFDNMMVAMEAMGLSEKLPTGIKANNDLWKKYQEITAKEELR